MDVPETGPPAILVPSLRSRHYSLALGFQMYIAIFVASVLLAYLFAVPASALIPLMITPCSVVLKRWDIVILKL